ncbi:MAG: hypothetical protein SWX82_13450 [Cyanobacteriota bacterium]|nr:hypothetical protein [Cyanobacteriota bacterium]
MTLPRCNILGVAYLRMGIRVVRVGGVGRVGGDRRRPEVWEECKL